MLCNALVSLGHVVVLPTRSLSVGCEQHVSAQSLSHFTALFIVVGAETRNDIDNGTLIEDGSGMCCTSGPSGMSYHGPSKKSEIFEKTACRDGCKGHQLKKNVTSSRSQSDVKSGINKTKTSEASFSVFFLSVSGSVFVCCCLVGVSRVVVCVRCVWV